RFVALASAAKLADRLIAVGGLPRGIATDAAAAIAGMNLREQRCGRRTARIAAHGLRRVERRLGGLIAAATRNVLESSLSFDVASVSISTERRLVGFGFVPCAGIRAAFGR